MDFFKYIGSKFLREGRTEFDYRQLEASTDDLTALILVCYDKY